MANLRVALADEYGWVLDYEDAPFQDTSAVEEDNTVIARWRQENPGKHVLLIKHRKFDLETTVPVGDSMTDAKTVLNQIIEKYNTGDNESL